MQFMVTGHDGNDHDALTRRLSAREAHISLGDEMRDRGELLFAVAILDEDEKLVGSVCIVEFPSREKLDDWLKVEPYVTKKVWRHVDIQACKVGPSFAE